MKINLHLVLGFSLLATTCQLLAEENFWNKLDFNKPIYAGFGFTANEVALISGEKVEGEITTRIEVDNDDYGNMLFLGMHYSERLDIETRYQNLGSYKQETQLVNAPEYVQTNTDTVLDYQSVNFLLRPKYQLGKYFQIQAEAGLSYVMLNRDAEVAVLGNRSPEDMEKFTQDAKSNLPSKSENKIALTYGLSLLYQTKGFLDWRWAIDRHQHGSEDFSSQSLSILHRFGSK